MQHTIARRAHHLTYALEPYRGDAIEVMLLDNHAARSDQTPLEPYQGDGASQGLPDGPLLQAHSVHSAHLS